MRNNKIKIVLYEDLIDKIDEMIDQAESSIEHIKSLGIKSFPYDLGYLDFNCDGSRRVFKIIDDQAESITLRSTGQWGYAQIGPDISVTLHLTRIGP
jgi:hypothetical protein